ncbi:LA_2272 family surface repeat-containing protein [Silvanigrella aquatica]|uniref:Uncharacterized protein n=1 Tax=Silvanigrella aquatica TaxID=1915309 RepID=A0A1L4D1S7_9BACT|nr:hypothetical protein [Silvanigrella aquatica]APJ04144.1 hypothetical protein AXG55_09600 [Silvanigrella aquatica]
MLKKLFIIFVIIFHFCCYSYEVQPESFTKIDTVPVRLSILSPYTDINFFSHNDNLLQENYFLLSLIYGETNYLTGVSISPFIINITHDMSGAQIALVNRVGGHFNGFQLGLFNDTHDFNGFQLGLWNRSTDFLGFQLGLYNKSDDFIGAQIGLINIANHVTGSQFGLINIADDQTGYSFGLLSFLLKTGQSKVSLWSDSEVPFNISIKAGKKYFYGLFEFDFLSFNQPNRNQYYLMPLYLAATPFYYLHEIGYSIGFGTQITYEPLWLESEIKWHDLFDETGKKLNYLQLQYSFLLGTTFEKKYDIFGVVSFNSHNIEGNGTPDVLNPEKYLPNWNYTISYGVGVQYLFAGVPNW